MNSDNAPPRLLDLVRQEIRVRHYSIRTEQAYVDWVKRFVFFHGKQHPWDMGTGEVRAFLSHLTVSSHVAASTQNPALNALVFLCREVLKQPFAELEDVVRAKKPQRLPVVLTREEAKRLLSKLEGPHWLAACLMYDSGLRLMDCLRLRVKTWTSTISP